MSVECVNRVLNCIQRRISRAFLAAKANDKQGSVSHFDRWQWIVGWTCWKDSHETGWVMHTKNAQMHIAREMWQKKAKQIEGRVSKRHNVLHVKSVSMMPNSVRVQYRRHLIKCLSFCCRLLSVNDCISNIARSIWALLKRLLIVALRWHWMKPFGRNVDFFFADLQCINYRFFYIINIINLNFVLKYHQKNRHTCVMQFFTFGEMNRHYHWAFVVLFSWQFCFIILKRGFSVRNKKTFTCFERFHKWFFAKRVLVTCQ